MRAARDETELAPVRSPSRALRPVTTVVSADDKAALAQLERGAKQQPAANNAAAQARMRPVTTVVSADDKAALAQLERGGSGGQAPTQQPLMRAVSAQAPATAAQARMRPVSFIAQPQPPPPQGAAVARTRAVTNVLSSEADAAGGARLRSVSNVGVPSAPVMIEASVLNVDDLSDGSGDSTLPEAPDDIYEHVYD